MGSLPSRVLAGCLPVWLLAACGGGGGSAGSGTPVASPAPAPAPAPAPSPSPTPTYGLATDFTSDRQYTGWGVEIVRDYKAPPPGSPAGATGTAVYAVTLKPETLGAGFSYTAANNTYTVRWEDFSKSYGPAVDTLLVNRIPISLKDDFRRYHPWIDNSSSDYARYLGAIDWQRYEGNGNALSDSVTRNYHAIFGIKTLPSDLPASGTYVFSFFPEINAVSPPRAADGSNLYQLAQSSWTMRIDYATRAITGTLRLDPSSSAPAGTQPLLITISGTLEADRTSVAGQFSGAAAGGSFTGNLFGPQGRELGFAYRITIGGAEAYAGVAGSRGL